MTWLDTLTLSNLQRQGWNNYSFIHSFIRSSIHSFTILVLLWFHYTPSIFLLSPHFFTSGPGICKIKITAPEGTSVGLRSPLLPFEASHTTGKFTGGRLLKRSKKSGEKAYGWRAWKVHLTESHVLLCYVLFNFNLE